MFEHLDDPRPPVPGDRDLRAVVRRGGRLRRRRRALRGGALAAAVLVLGVGGLYGRAALRVADIERIEVAGTGPVAAGEPVTVLVLGVDGPGADGHGGAGGGTADTILAVRIDPATRSGSALSLPRDLMVDDPGGGGPVRLGSLTATGSGGAGVGAVVEAVESQVGIPVDHTVVLDMAGLVSLVDDAGGVAVRAAVPMRDASTGMMLDATVCTALDGEGALALVRSRHIEVRDGHGRWVRDPQADLRRVDIQRQVVLAAVAGAGGGGIDPATVNERVDWAVDNLQVDVDWSVGEMREAARVVLDLDLDAVHMATVPVVSRPDDENRLVLAPDLAADAVRAFTTGAALPAAPPDGGTGVGAAPSPGAPAVAPC